MKQKILWLSTNFLFWGSRDVPCGSLELSLKLGSGPIGNSSTASITNNTRSEQKGDGGGTLMRGARYRLGRARSNYSWLSLFSRYFWKKKERPFIVILRHQVCLPFRASFAPKILWWKVRVGMQFLLGKKLLWSLRMRKEHQTKKNPELASLKLLPLKLKNFHCFSIWYMIWLWLILHFQIYTYLSSLNFWKILSVTGR